MLSQNVQLLILSLATCVFVGHAKPPSKIVNGQNALTGEFPHQVSLQTRKRHICGGSIIDATHILTAAHCVLNDDGSVTQGIDVVTGTLDSLNRTVDNVFMVSRISYHTRYSPKDSWRNDIAIITLRKPIPYNEYQRPINLPTSNVPPGARVVASGWGAEVYLGDKTRGVRYLQKLPMSVLGVHQCQKILGTRIQYQQICVASAATTGVCLGDSGGPLTYGDTIVGIASWVIPCGTGYPDVYTRVYEYLSWIQRVLQEK